MPAPQDLLTPAQLPANARTAVEPVRLGLFITAISESLAAYVGYPLLRRQGVVETVAGTGAPHLWLSGGAVRQVVRVEVRGVELEPDAYALESSLMGRLVARRHRWPFTGTWSPGVSSTPMEAQDTGEVRVTYDAGWVTPGQAALDETLVVDLPASIQLAAVEACTAALSRDGKPGDVASESIGGTSMSYFAGPDGGRVAFPATALQLLGPYRKRRR
ncbi:hypothetical protein [Comamonas sp. JC664]|uniref:hypothetical protein n=1 Tax=Comamonas sp. JC664 TaxID=2801917 RepID=UPI00174DB3F3|nr:hypothetical protein [Comamonas sp. JC664]MBL0698941.1 hypothetical protein [Comamonas sp. JC664]GHG79669.1 hypothetical protein GCM10012319_31760 [Comamonas sp. KCTC 72670]